MMDMPSNDLYLAMGPPGFEPGPDDEPCEDCERYGFDLRAGLCEECGADCEACGERWPNSFVIFVEVNEQTHNFCPECQKLGEE